MTGDEYARYTAATPAVLQRDVDLADRRIERGSVLPVVSRDEKSVVLMQPEGKTFDLAPQDVRFNDDNALATERVARALDVLYRPYVFGAVAPIGMDCSGLVRNVCTQTGVSVARDAAQQFLHGELVATRWHRDDIRPGDFLFFIDLSGKIYHVGIAITPTHFVHSSPPEVKVTSLVKGDRLYVERREMTFFAAKRW
jgi:cell wall-associated NlpC family hydrolase